MELVMIDCPKCGKDFPEKRKELGYHVCVNCSSVKPKVGVTTVEGTGDHTYNDIIIMDQDTYISIKKKEAELAGKSVHIEMLDLDKDEAVVSQSVKEEVSKVLDEDYVVDDVDMFDPNKEMEGIEGIDY
jgi:DNA-directed RNA polymerase subunit RPC12/RpoP|tara:strand:- start:8115 stop:8501 length:387 start_codon:yes stop_codon:yes gene_type:complete